MHSGFDSPAERVARALNGVAHEVRNPLNAIQAALSALELDLQLTDENAVLFRAIRSKLQRIAELMRELIEFSKPLDRACVESVDAELLCMQAISSWRMRHPEQPHERVVLLATTHGAMIRADPAKMRDALLHLIENAHQYAPAGSCIEVHLEHDAADCRVRVVDRGPGVKAELLGRIFEPFFTTHGGTGLGLSIVQNIVEQHGGGIALTNNELEPGCTAEVVLPAARTAPRTKAQYAGETVTR